MGLFIKVDLLFERAVRPLLPHPLATSLPAANQYFSSKFLAQHHKEGLITVLINNKAVNNHFMNKTA